MFYYYHVLGLFISHLRAKFTPNHLLATHTKKQCKVSKKIKQIKKSNK